MCDIGAGDPGLRIRIRQVTPADWNEVIHIGKESFDYITNPGEFFLERMLKYHFFVGEVNGARATTLTDTNKYYLAVSKHMGIFGRFGKKKRVEPTPKKEVFEERPPAKLLIEEGKKEAPKRRVPLLEPAPKEVIEHQKTVFNAILQHPRVIWRDDSGTRKYLIVKHSNNLHHIVELSSSGFDEIRIRAMRLGELPEGIQHPEAMAKILEEAFQEKYNAEFDYKYAKDLEKRQLAEEVLMGAKTKLLEKSISIINKSPEEVQRMFYELLKAHILQNKE